MIEKRINYQFGGGADASQDDFGGGNTSTSTGGGDARDRAMGLQGKTGRVDPSLGTGPLGVDRSAVGQFSQFGRNLMQQNLRPSFTERLKGMGSNIFGGILGLINPAFGFAYKGIGSLKNLGQYDTLADCFKGEFGKTEDEEDQVQTFDLGPSRNPSISLGIMNPNIRPTQKFNFDPTQFNTRNRNLGELVAEVTQKDINASKARGFNMMDYDTARSIGMISPNVTPYEFEQLKQGNITKPGTYVG